MDYEFEKYNCTIKSLKETLEEYGVAIIPNLLDDNECKAINNGIWDYFEHITQNWKDELKPINRENSKTWENIYQLYPLHSQLFKYWGVGHSQVLWDFRQNEKVVNVFSHLWNCKKEDLFVSYDGFSFCIPPEITNKGWENKPWFHTDQSYLRNDLECIQSWVTANDVEEGDGSLTIMEGSHKYHAECGKTFNINDKKDWYKLNSIEQRFYEDKKCAIKKIKCPKGSMVLWDSRTIHYGSNPMKKRKNKNFRSILYLCYMKKELCTISQIEKKKDMFVKKQTSNHWPCNPKPNTKYPNTYGKKLPQITEIETPKLNDLGLSLIGMKD